MDPVTMMMLGGTRAVGSALSNLGAAARGQASPMPQPTASPMLPLLMSQKAQKPMVQATAPTGGVAHNLGVASVPGGVGNQATPGHAMATPAGGMSPQSVAKWMALMGMP